MTIIVSGNSWSPLQTYSNIINNVKSGVTSFLSNITGVFSSSAKMQRNTFSQQKKQYENVISEFKTLKPRISAPTDLKINADSRFSTDNMLGNGRVIYNGGLAGRMLTRHINGVPMAYTGGLMKPQDGHVKYNGGLLQCHHNRYSTNSECQNKESIELRKMADSVNRIEQGWGDLLVNKPENGNAHFRADSGDIYTSVIKNKTANAREAEV